MYAKQAGRKKGTNENQAKNPSSLRLRDKNKPEDIESIIFR